MTYFNERLMVAGLRWTARILGIALAAPVVLFAVWAIGQDGFSAFTRPLHENLVEVALWVMTIGVLTGWKWEGIGGLLTLGGVAMLGIADYQFVPNVQVVVGTFVGLLYLVCWWRTSRSVSDAEPEEMELGRVTRFLKRFSIPLVLMLAHAFLVALIAIHIALSSDPEAGMVWIAFNYFDYPLSMCIDLLPHFFTSNAIVPWTILTVGTIQWGIIGLVLQRVLHWLRRNVKRFRH